MALYKYVQFLTLRSDLTDFDYVYGPAAITPASGIYRCEGCGREITSVRGHPFPPQNHHQHGAGQGTIRWQLTVMSTHAG